MREVTRIHRGQIQTPVWTYRHRDSGRTVTLVGMMHVGEPAYYAAVQSLVASLVEAGAVVQFEGVRTASAEEMATATPRELAAIASINQLLQVITRMGEGLGWTSQKTGLKYDPAWTNVDLNDLELVRLLNLADLDRAVADAAEQMTELEQTDPVMMAASMAMIFRAMHSRSGRVMVDVLSAFNRAQRRRHQPADAEPAPDLDQLHEVVVGQRDPVAVEGIWRAAAHQDVALIWGAAHLPGMGALIEEHGYQRISASWLSVGRPPSILASLRIMYRQSWVQAKRDIEAKEAAKHAAKHPHHDQPKPSEP
ncbi:MAG TPA: hypothetical protein VLF67_04325 [Candidatus Saccharimonas sp.]|nr:hypothetical protein [Candidatus Saccharimonas sp.]